MTIKGRKLTTQDHNGVLKLLIMKKLLSYAVLICFLFASTKTYAWKFFGSENQEVTSAEGCTVTTYEVTYFFGFKTKVEPINVEYICGFDYYDVYQF